MHLGGIAKHSQRVNNMFYYFKKKRGKGMYHHTKQTLFIEYSVRLNVPHNSFYRASLRLMTLNAEYNVISLQ